MVRVPISRDSLVVVSNDQVSADLMDEAAILHLESGVYFALDLVGSRIWQLIQEPRTIAQIESALLKEYDVNADRCAVEVLAFVEALADEGLVEVKSC